MVEELKRLKNEIKTLEQSNKLMESELSLKRSEISFLNSVLDDRCAEITRLKTRGFWARVFNL